MPITLTVSGTSNTIDFIGVADPGSLTVGLEGASNSARLNAGTLQVSGTANQLSIARSVTATITGSSNRLTPVGGPVYTFVGSSNTIVAVLGRAVTSTRGDGQIYTVEPGGTLVITEPNFETLWTGAGTLSLAGGKMLQQQSPTSWVIHSAQICSPFFVMIPIESLGYSHRLW